MRLRILSAAIQVTVLMSRKTPPTKPPLKRMKKTSVINLKVPATTMKIRLNSIKAPKMQNLPANMKIVRIQSPSL